MSKLLIHRIEHSSLLACRERPKMLNRRRRILDSMWQRPAKWPWNRDAGARAAILMAGRIEQNFVGREIAQHRDYNEETAIRIDAQVKKLVQGGHDTAVRIIEEHSEALLMREILDGNEVMPGPSRRDPALPGISVRHRTCRLPGPRRSTFPSSTREALSACT